ncbi:hypothetical protein BaRGS_00027630, partial [Batillaria attramentaria]
TTPSRRSTTHITQVRPFVRSSRSPPSKEVITTRQVFVGSLISSFPNLVPLPIALNFRGPAKGKRRTPLPVKQAAASGMVERVA